ncbi:MAG: helix-turn-helix domain-containing protein [Gammaproteobacteria bacterium]|nr:helix-turn-helix domain-containing protein [Gammaproteobacteria bacterium]
MKAGHNQSETANIVGVHKATISREVRRNRGLRGTGPGRPSNWLRPAVNTASSPVLPTVPGARLNAGCGTSGARSRSAMRCVTGTVSA